jgi:6-pyruvoyl-tetrahydropterin synthase
VFVEGVVDAATGFVMDYAEISNAVKPLIGRLDHRHLGAWTPLFHKPMNSLHSVSMVPGLPDEFYPSSENLLIWIGNELAGMRWSKLALEETCTSYAELSREEFDAIGNQK